MENNIEIVEADLSTLEGCLKALRGIDIAYYLVHSMEGGTKDWKSFSEREKLTAENFKQAVDECNVKRVIYLGGLTQSKDNELSQHMKSRKEVGMILQKSTAKVTIFRAAVILGSGGGSFEMLRYLVERLPFMVCPKWVLTKCQPIFIGDVITYLSKSIDVKETEGRTFDIGGLDILTYKDMMKVYSRMLSRPNLIIIIPFLTPRLSSYWVDLVTPIKASLARPLIDSLKHEAVVKNNDIKEIIPLEVKSFKESLQYCLGDRKEAEVEKNSSYIRKIGKNKQKKERTSTKTNYKILLLSLIFLLVIGTTYYFLDNRKEFLEPMWIFVAVIWYSSIIGAIYFVRFGARLGALIAGIVGWGTLLFWAVDNIYIIAGYSIIASNPDNYETWRNIIGIIVAVVTIVSSHNIFHKSRMDK